MSQRRPGSSSFQRLAAATCAVSVAAVVVVAGLTGCADDAESPRGATVVDDAGRLNRLHGAPPERNFTKPALDLTDTTGAPFDLRARTAEKVTFVYFGYTNCQDVCPATMADLAAALRDLEPAVRSDVAVVFVTVDPRRDTPAVLDAWLRQFDSTFVGVTGPLDRVRTEAEQFGVEIDDPAPMPDGSYNITHSAHTTVFTRDGRSRVVYPAGTLVEHYLDDIPILATVGAML